MSIFSIRIISQDDSQGIESQAVLKILLRLGCFEVPPVLHDILSIDLVAIEVPWPQLDYNHQLDGLQ